MVKWKSVVVLAKRQRRSNFFPTEINILVDEVEKRIQIINASFSSSVTNRTKTRCWEEIADRVCAESAVVRSATDARKKWNDLKCHVKKKAQHMKHEAQRTGGGPAPHPLTELELRILSLIPTCQVDGVSGGLETGVLTDEPSVKSGDLRFQAALPDGSLTSPDAHTEHCSTDMSSGSEMDSDEKRQPKPGQLKSSVSEVMELEKEKLAVLREILALGRERLVVDMQQLAVETERLSRKASWKLQMFSVKFNNLFNL